MNWTRQEEVAKELERLKKLRKEAKELAEWVYYDMELSRVRMKIHEKTKDKVVTIKIIIEEK